MTFSSTVASVLPGGSPTPGGTVTYTLDGVPAAPQPIDSHGVSTRTFSLCAGAHSLSARYDGDSNYLPSTSFGALSIVVDQASTAVMMSSNPAQLNQPVAIRAAPQMLSPASGYIDGTVDFLSGTAIAGCTGVFVQNGVAICNTTFSQLGTFTVIAGYHGDANIKPSNGFLIVTVAKVVAGGYLAYTPAAPVFGAPVTVSMLLLGATGVAAPTGTVTFADGTATLGTASVGTDGRASLVLPSLTTGTHSISAVYGGDANYQSATREPAQVAVGKAATTLTLASTPAQVGQSAMLRAAVTLTSGGVGTPAGTVSFTIQGDPVAGCTALATPVQGVVQCASGPLAFGTYNIGASYSGDANTMPSTASTQLSVGKLLPGFYTAWAPPAPVSGEPVTVSALVVGATGVVVPTGTVAFLEGAVTLAAIPVGSDGRASLVVPSGSLAPLSAGVHSLMAQYSGDANYQATSGPLTIGVAKASTTIAITSNPPLVGQPLALKATVTVVSPGIAVPAGSVDFSRGGAAIAGCTALPTQSGIATCNTTVSQSGDYTITAGYNGDANTAASTATRSLTAGKAATAILTASTPAAPVYGTQVTFTAALAAATGAPIPTGNVTFSDGTVLRVVIPVGTDGRASLVLPSGPLAALAAGSHSFVLVYSGDATYAGVTAPALNLVVAKALTTTVLTAAAGAPLAATVTVLAPGAGTPTGMVQFLQGAAAIGTAAVVPAGSAFAATLPAGSLTGNVTAVYQGDANFSPSTSQSVTVGARAQVAIASGRNPSIAGQSVTFTVRVTAASGSGTPGGSVQLSADGAGLGTAALAGGQATFSATLSVGSHTVAAGYSGDSVFAAASSTLVQVVNQASTSLSLTSSAGTTVYGQPVTFTAQLASAGTVQFADGSTALGSTQASGGVATLVVANLPAGTHSITATLSGDAGPAAAVSMPLALTVNQAQTATTLVASGATLTASVTVVAPGAGSPSGTVRFVDAATNALLATAALAGSGAATPRPSTADPIVAVYSGDGNFQPSISPTLSPLTAVNAASYTSPGFAPDELVSLFGSNLAAQTVSAVPSASLGGTNVTVTDSAGVKRAAELLFVSPAQVNFVMPPGTASGPATVTVANASQAAVSTAIAVTPVAPGLFTLNGTGQGVPAAQIVRAHADGTQDAPQVVAVFDSAQGQWIPAPIDLGAPTDAVYLVLYVTGLRHRAATPAATLGGQPVPVAYAGAQGGFAGLDQVNLALPLSLRGAGTVDLKLVVDGAAANTVTLAFQ